MELRVFRRQRAQPVRGVQFLKHCVHDLPLSFLIQHGKRHGYRPDLVAADLPVRIGAGNHILQTVLILHPETPVKRYFYLFCLFSVQRAVLFTERG